MVAVAAVAATAAYIRRLRVELAAAKRDNDEFVAEVVRGTPSRQQQQAPPQQAPPQQVIEQRPHEHFECCSRARPCAYPAPHFTRIRHSTNRSFDLLLMSG